MLSRLQFATDFWAENNPSHPYYIFNPDRCAAPSLCPYAWKDFGPLFPEPLWTGGNLPSTWGKAPLRFQMHEIISVNSGQYCHCWLSQGCLKGLFPIVFPRTCPKMFPSKPPSRKTPAEEQRTIAHKVPSSIAISRISAVKVN